jgi:hypothetical protein
MNFDTPTAPLRVSVDVIATITFGSSGHWTTDSFLEATPQPMVSSGREGINIETMTALRVSTRGPTKSCQLTIGLIGLSAVGT